MSRGITFKKLWSDGDVVELEIITSDGESTFRCRVFTSHAGLKSATEGLRAFKDHVHGGIFDLSLGRAGPEFASGAFHARLHFHSKGLGRLFMTVAAESEWFEFTETKVANRYAIHLVTEPALLDKFIGEIMKLQEGVTEQALLQLASI